MLLLAMPEKDGEGKATDHGVAALRERAKRTETLRHFGLRYSAYVLTG